MSASVRTIAMAWLLAAASASGQSISLQTQRVGVIGDEMGSGALSAPADFALRLRDGRIVVSEMDEVPIVFDSTGKFIKRLSRKGSGPGEISGYVTQLRAAGDSLYVVHGTVVSVFGRELQFVRNVKIGNERGIQLIMHPDGFIVSRQMATARVTDRLAVLDRAGIPVRSFAPETMSRSVMFGAYRIEPGAGDHFWATRGGRPFRRRVERWTLDGKVQQVGDTLPPWWPQGAVPVPPYVASVRETPEVVWVVSRVPTPEAAAHMPKATGEMKVTALPYERLYNSRIEAYDPQSRRLLADTAVPGFVVGMLDDRHYLRYMLDSNDIPRLEIWRVDVKRR